MQNPLPIFPSNPFTKKNISIDDFKNIHTAMPLLGKVCSSYIGRYNHSIFFGGDHLSSYGTILGSLLKYGNDINCSLSLL